MGLPLPCDPAYIPAGGSRAVPGLLSGCCLAVWFRQNPGKLLRQKQMRITSPRTIDPDRCPAPPPRRPPHAITLPVFTRDLLSGAMQDVLVGGEPLFSDYAPACAVAGGATRSPTRAPQGSYPAFWRRIRRRRRARGLALRGSPLAPRRSV